MRLIIVGLRAWIAEGRDQLLIARYLPRCSFCGRRQNPPDIIEGSCVKICASCVEFCNEIIAERRDPAAARITPI